MEEYRIKVIQVEQPENKQFDLKHNTSLGVAVAAIHRHVSVRYGMEFQSKVSLYSKDRVSMQNVNSIESIAKEVLFKKTISFLQSSCSDSKKLESIVDVFRKLDKEMSLSIHRSRQSISSINSEQVKGMGSEKISINLGSSGSVESMSQSSGNQSDKGTINKAMIRSQSPEKQNGGSLPKLKKAKTSMMSKMNRVSLADAINISEISNFKVDQIQSIPSSESVTSQSQGSFNEFNSRCDLTSDPSQTSSVSKQSMTSLNKVLKLERNKKISIMIIDDFTSGSEIFSEEEILSLKDLKISEVELNQHILDVYFDFYSPYLVNLALCLLFKLISKSKVNITQNSIGWMLGVATLVSYKVYYDEPIDGLMQYFGDTLSMSVNELARLQRWFLLNVDYEVVVSTQQFQSMMFRLLSVRQ